jgi:alanine-alpha-ketoisovalerate/valine-pyruvate aminotransferase
MNISIDGKSVYDPTSNPELHEEINKLLCEVERLKEVLQEIAEYPSFQGTANLLSSMAREALQGSEYD